MIRLTMYKQAEGGYAGFTCKGHAGYGTHGQDIVCAGVSALVITTVQSIETLTSDEIESHSDEDTGTVTCRFHRPASKEAALLLDALLLGCRSIRETYGTKYITITFKEV